MAKYWKSFSFAVLRNNDKSINTICTLPDYCYAQEIPFAMAFFVLFIFDVFTSMYSENTLSSYVFSSQANTYENRNLSPQTRLQTAIRRRDEIPIHSDPIQFSWRHFQFIYETFPCISDNPMIRLKTSHSYIKPNFTLCCFTLHSNYIVLLYKL